MKKHSSISRKHGRKALIDLTRKHVRLHNDSDIRQAGLSMVRLKTLLTFETSSQSYLWITDRGRSRLIKH